MMEHGVNVTCVTIKEDNLHTPSGDVRNAKKYLYHTGKLETDCFLLYYKTENIL